MKYFIWGFLLLIFGCTDKIEIEPREYAGLQTLSISDINEEGATFNGEITRLGNESIIDFGFVWSIQSTPTLLNSDRIALGETNKTGVFSASAKNKLSSGAKYYLRTYLESTESLVYGNIIEFESKGSLGPNLKKFEPLQGDLRDTVIVIGSEFSSVKDENSVLFDSVEAEIISYKEDSLVVIVPETLTSIKPKVSVRVAGQVTTFDQEFSLTPPTIDGFQFNEILFGQTVEIITSYYPKEIDLVSIALENISGERLVLNKSETLSEPLRFVIPENLSFHNFYVVLGFNNQEFKSETLLNLVAPTISKLSDNKIKYHERIRIYGEGFSPIARNNRVWLDTMEVQVKELNVVVNDEDYIEVEVPDPLNRNFGRLGGAYSSREIDVRVNVLGREYTLSDALEINNQWFRLPDSPMYSPAKVVTTDKAAFLFYYESLWRFDNQGWRKLSKFPGNISEYSVTLYAGEDIYVGITNSSNEFWKYSIDRDSWEMISALPSKNMSAVFCEGGDQFYILGDLLERDSPSEFWKYSTVTMNWEQLSNPPFSDIEGRAVKLDNSMLVAGSAFENILSYNFQSETWGVFSNHPSNSIDSGIFKIDSELFITGISNQYNIFKYDFKTATWVDMEHSIVSGSEPFVLNNKMYLLSNYNGRYHFWEFDPNR